MAEPIAVTTRGVAGIADGWSIADVTIATGGATATAATGEDTAGKQTRCLLQITARVGLLRPGTSAAPGTAADARAVFDQ
jgi:hypothetical protein